MKKLPTRKERKGKQRKLNVISCFGEQIVPMVNLFLDDKPNHNEKLVKAE